MKSNIIGFYFLLTACAVSVNVMSGGTSPDITFNQSGSQYLAYPVNSDNAPVLSPSPKGYYPFHMEHYGRHGSRWRIREKDYEDAYSYFRKAEEEGKLTDKGREVALILKKIKDDSRKKGGELTPLGHRQHREIAQRMAANYPELFTDSTFLDAKSTVIIRCILSMANEVAELQSLFPEMPVTMDASYSTWDVLAYNSHDTVAKKLSRMARDKVKSYAETLPKPETFYKKLFKDMTFLPDSISETTVFEDVFDIAVNMQSHDSYPSLADIFTPEEWYNEWKARNADWYISAGNTPLTNNRVPFNQRYLLRNIIESADSAMTSQKKSVNLRFGHESILLPLSVLMELGNAAYETTDLSTLETNWRNYEIFPMGSNIQMIFYRPYSETTPNPDNVLVKVTLNEREVSLPVKAVEGNYYRWKDLRDYYMEKLDGFNTMFKE